MHAKDKSHLPARTRAQRARCAAAIAARPAADILCFARWIFGFLDDWVDIEPEENRVKLGLQRFDCSLIWRVTGADANCNTQRSTRE